MREETLRSLRQGRTSLLCSVCGSGTASQEFDVSGRLVASRSSETSVLSV